VILDSVIEHVAGPRVVVAEARRILSDGGVLFESCPFLTHCHGYPGLYRTFTRDGLTDLLRDFREVRLRPSFGPVTALVNQRPRRPLRRGQGLGAPADLLAQVSQCLFVRVDRSHRVSGMLNATSVK
jgi:hypothetical protein